MIEVEIIREEPKPQPEPPIKEVVIRLDPESAKALRFLVGWGSISDEGVITYYKNLHRTGILPSQLRQVCGRLFLCLPEQDK